ncbi:MAG: hypothetical protein IPO07_21985 [Haliscomenobacter sp.]|nr:hypothetical protein [Haliscomenobacter sp.]MBK9491157.1 hypothetical protein [Haliscomenobacter sp.]
MFPPKLLFPGDQRQSRETIIPNPRQKAEAWSDEMKVERDKGGNRSASTIPTRSERRWLGRSDHLKQ